MYVKKLTGSISLVYRAWPQKKINEKRNQE